MQYCYECSEPSPVLSSRSRCIKCEERRARFNESENERLRHVLAINGIDIKDEVDYNGETSKQ